MKPINRINELKKNLNKWGKEYYTLDNPTVSDAQYDGAMEELKKLEVEFPELITKDSPTQKVGGVILDKFVKVKHQFPMLSLANAFNAEDLQRFNDQIKREMHLDGNIEYACELKIDGLSISLIYKNGKLDKAITRGNGIVGEDVTHNVKTISSIPHQINYKKDLEIRGEVYMSDKVFQYLNSKGENFANPRNAAAGTLRQLDSSIAMKRKLDAFLYMIPNPLDHNLKSQKEVLDFLKQNNFPINPQTKIVPSIEKVVNFVETYTEKDLGYAYDGIVIKVNNITMHEEIGYTAKAPKYMIAYKFPEEVATTELLDIFPTVGRTGRITYNAKLSPVRLAGTVVSAATLHNADYITELRLSKTDIVQVKKAGEIIPKVIGVSEKKGNEVWVESTLCPECENALYRKEGEVDQYCTFKECPAILKAKIQHYVSRGAMDIQGLGERIVERLIKENLLDSIPGIYKLDRNKLLKLEGFKEKSVDKLLASIENSKNQKLHKFIFGLGIRHVGAKYAKILSNRYGTLEAIINAGTEQLSDIREVGPKVLQSISQYFKTHKELLNELIAVGIKPQEGLKMESSTLQGKTFVLTGTLSSSRKHFVDIIERNGGNVSSSVSSRTNYLLAGENAGSKKDKADSLGVKVISEEDLQNIIGGTNV